MKNQMLTKRQACDILVGQLKNEASSFTSHWRDLSDYILPRRTKFFQTDTNKGDKRNKNIIDPTATMSARTLRSGMMAGVTSPARRWARLGFADPEVSNIPRVKTWLKQVEDAMFAIFSRSNLYQCLPIIYGDMGTFGTAAMFVERDLDNVLRFTTFPIGSFYIANDEKLKVRVFYREFQMSVRQIVEQFVRDPYDPEKMDWSKASINVKNLWESGQTEAWINVSHIVKPNPEYNPKLMLSKFKKYVSYYYETGAGTNEQSSNIGEQFLSEKGFDYFPVLCPRWEVTGEDVYGTNCPGMTCLGDVKQLQLGEKRAAQAIEKIVSPPMVAPTSMKGKSSSILPGDVTYVDDKDLGKGFRPAYQVDGSVIMPLENKQSQVRSRIQRAYYEDLFLMLTENDGRMTATEVVERKEEKLLVLGPVLEQIDQDLLDPLIDIAFYEMTELGLIPEAPEEIQGADIKVEYISIMAQAQKLAGIGSIERFVGFVGQVASFKPGALDLVDEDEMVRTYGDLSGAPLNIIKSQDKVDAARAAQAAAAQQQAQMEQAGAAVDAAKSLSETSMETNSALSSLLS